MEKLIKENGIKKLWVNELKTRVLAVTEKEDEDLDIRANLYTFFVNDDNHDRMVVDVSTDESELNITEDCVEIKLE